MFRKVLFWLHLIAGCIAGIVVLIMSVTGVLLTYEKQMIYSADTRGVRIKRQELRPSLDEILAASGRSADAVTLRAGNEPIALQSGRSAVYLDPNTGKVVAEGNASVREFFHTMTDWHRWLGAHGDSRPTGRAITGASNLAFLFIVISGAYLWLPKIFSKRHFLPIVLFRGGLAGKARDFNWHNVIGIWCLVPLFVIVLSGVVISYPWAGDLVYRAVGENPPPRPQRGPSGPGNPGGAGREGRKPLALPQGAWQQALDTASDRNKDWRTITLRPAPSGKEILASVDGGGPGQPHLRTALTISTAGEVLKEEPFDNYTTGRKARFWLRFLHTGESFGIVGQTIAGIASLGTVFLVWTGISLSLRRLAAWRKRRANLKLEPDALRERELV